MVWFASIIKLQNKVFPLWIMRLYERNLPVAFPFFDGFLSRDSVYDEGVSLKPNEPRHIIGCRETLRVMAGFMLLKARAKVAGHADI